MYKNTYFGSLNAIIFGNVFQMPEVVSGISFLQRAGCRISVMQQCRYSVTSLLETLTADVRIIPT